MASLSTMSLGMGDFVYCAVLTVLLGTETAEAAKAVEGVDSGIRRRGGPRKAKAEAKKDIRGTLTVASCIRSH